jgi:hypothetical protein
LHHNQPFSSFLGSGGSRNDRSRSLAGLTKGVAALCIGDYTAIAIELAD